jgi:hypothetical protein
MRVYRRRSTAARSPIKPFKYYYYLRFVRSLPCCVCGREGHIEAARFGGGDTLREHFKQTLPLCESCRRTRSDSYQRLGPVAFAAAHYLRPERVIERINQMWEEKIGEKVA